MFIFLFFSTYDVYSNYKEKEKNKTQKVQQGPSTTVMNINNITCFVQPSGFHPNFYGASWSSAFPKGTAGGIFQEGVVWGGLVNDGQSPTLRVGGNTYFSGTHELDRIYRVRPDYKTANLSDDAANSLYYQNYPLDLSAVSDADLQTIRNQYETDWMEWPAHKGAPYDDVDGDGSYDPNVDIPGIPGASQTIWLIYDDAIAPQAYGSPPIGLEVQETYWAYAYTGALGNVIFKKADIVYKGTEETPPNATITDMYLVQWADPDVGQYTDDFAGCDSSLNLGYAYSSDPVDAIYSGLGLNPPAIGYDFFQGVSQFTGNPSDSAIFNLKWRTGYKYVHSKPMTAFTYFASGGAWSDPDGQDPLGTPQWYNLMRGFLPRPEYPASTPFPENVGGTAQGFGTYLLSGDPVTGTGIVDGVVEGPGDRRIVCVHGPFNMALNDTAQVVLALVAGIGSNNLNSITELKKNDNIAQIVFNNLFQLPTMPQPSVAVTPLDGKIILNWGDTQSNVQQIESYADEGYTFEGYNVYMLPSPTATLEEGELLATYDVVNDIGTITDTIEERGVFIPVIVERGNNSGLKRYLEITEDPFRNQPLRNGQEYYFKVISYAHNPAPLLPFHSLRSNSDLLTAVPQSNLPGVRYSYSYGDTVEGIVHTGASDGFIAPIVIDPSQLTGLSYTVKFDTLRVATSDTTSELITVWHVDRSDGIRVVTNETNQNADETSPIVDGIQFRVSGAPNDFKEFLTVSNANGPIDPPEIGAFAFNASGFPFLPYTISANYFGTPDALNDRPSDNQQAGEGHYGIHTGSVGDDLSFDHFKDRVTRSGGNYSHIIPYDFEIRFTAAGGQGQMAFTSGTVVNVPFEVWNIGIGTPNDPSDDVRLVPLINDANGNEIFDVDGVDHQVSGGDNDPETDWVYIYDVLDHSPGQAGYDAVVASGFNDGIGDEVMARLTFVNWNGGSVSDPTFPANLNQIMPETGTVFRIVSTKPNQAFVDEFTFTAPTKTVNTDLARLDVEKINVFPNPYYGTHYREVTREGKYVTFSHLPARATIRIFDLAGVLVATIDKNGPDQFVRWNLQNNNNYPVASGIYVVHIDMPELGATKILKLAIIQEEQILRVY
jgi:hypothetical protein